MKHILSIFFFSLLIISCQKERENIEEKPQLPDTVNLIESTITGKILNDEGEAIGQSEVAIFYQDYELTSTTSTISGDFTLNNAPIHASNSYVRITKEGYSPNFYAQTLTNGASVELLPVLKPWVINESNNNATKVLNADNLQLNLPEALFASERINKVQIQWLDFEVDSKETLLATRTESEELSLRYALYINGIDSDGTSIDWSDNKSVTMQLNGTPELDIEAQVWFFNLDKAYWEAKGTIDQNGSNYTYTVTGPGFYAFTSACSNDVEAPTPYCINLTSASFPNLNNAIIWAEDFNIGSFDNCTASDDLLFDIRRLTDPCNNGSTIFADSLALCPSDDGLTIDVIVKVTDEAMNADSCLTTIQVMGDTTSTGDCTNDVDSPVPYCINLATLVFTPSLANEVWAVDFNVGSYDNCTLEDSLVYKIKKVNDICNNGSDTLAEKILICPEEVGEVLILEMHVFDENNNSDYCTVSMTVN